MTNHTQSALPRNQHGTKENAQQGGRAEAEQTNDLHFTAQEYRAALSKLRHAIGLMMLAVCMGRTVDADSMVDALEHADRLLAGGAL